MVQGAFARAAGHGAGRIARSIRDSIPIGVFRPKSELSEAFIRTLKFEIYVRIHFEL